MLHSYGEITIFARYIISKMVKFSIAIVNYYRGYLKRCGMSQRDFSFAVDNLSVGQECHTQPVGVDGFASLCKT
jgi:hypothetical protein